MDLVQRQVLSEEVQEYLGEEHALDDSVDPVEVLDDSQRVAQVFPVQALFAFVLNIHAEGSLVCVVHGGEDGEESQEKVPDLVPPTARRYHNQVENVELAATEVKIRQLIFEVYGQRLILLGLTLFRPLLREQPHVGSRQRDDLASLAVIPARCTGLRIGVGGHRWHS